MTADQQAELALRADEAWKQLPPDAKIRLLNLHKALTGMQPEERRFVHERIERFLNLSPADRDRIKKNSDRWHSMSPEERERARDTGDKEALRQFREKRQGLMDLRKGYLEKFRATLTDEQKTKLDTILEEMHNKQSRGQQHPKTPPATPPPAE